MHLGILSDIINIGIGCIKLLICCILVLIIFVLAYGLGLGIGAVVDLSVGQVLGLVCCFFPVAAYGMIMLCMFLLARILNRPS